MIFSMALESSGRICLKSAVPLNIIHSQMKTYIRSFEPPYNIDLILSEFSSKYGIPYEIVITHASNDVSITQLRELPRRVATQVQNVKSQPMHGTGHHQWSHTAPVSRSMSKSSGLTCSICLENISTHELYFLPVCEHIFHKKCLFIWAGRANSCPTCRTPLSLKYKSNGLPTH